MPLRLRPRGERAHALGIARRATPPRARRGTRPDSEFSGSSAASPSAWRSAHVDRARERLELVARVVDVELRRDARAPCGAEDARERVAHRGRARVDDHERAGRIGRDELEEDAVALPRVSTVP